MTSKMSTRIDLANELVRLEPSLRSSGIQDLRDIAIDLDTPNTYNIANTQKLRAEVATVLSRLMSTGAISAADAGNMFKGLTEENTSVGFLSQIQCYAYFFKRQIQFRAEVSSSNTLRQKCITLDGRFDLEGQAVYFEIKSFGFEPELRETFRRKLENSLPGSTISIDGTGNLNADEIQSEALTQIDCITSSLQTKNFYKIPSLGWTIRKKKKETGVTISEHEYNPEKFIEENKHVPLRFGSQFTTDTPFILLIVAPSGVGSSPIKANIFGFSEDVIKGISRHVFETAINDQSNLANFDKKAPNGLTVERAVRRLSALALYCPQENLFLFHVNLAADAQVPSALIQALAGSDFHVHGCKVLKI